MRVSTGPVDLAAGEVVVTLFGTGLPLAEWKRPFSFRGPGLDRIIVLVPPELRGRGLVPIAVSVSGRAANVVAMTVRQGLLK